MAYTRTGTSRFDTTEYELSHGRKPRGGCSWAFRDADEADVIENVVFAPSALTFSEAKRWAATVALPRARRIVVCS